MHDVKSPICFINPLTQVWLVWCSCPPIVWEDDQVGICVCQLSILLGGGHQWLYPVPRGEWGHHQDAIILLAVADPLWHLEVRTRFISSNARNTAETSQNEILHCNRTALNIWMQEVKVVTRRKDWTMGSVLPFEWHWRLPILVSKGAPILRWWGFLSMASLGCPAPHTDPPVVTTPNSSLNCEHKREQRTIPEIRAYTN